MGTCSCCQLSIPVCVNVSFCQPHPTTTHMQNVEATGKRFVVSVDVSASLSSTALGSSVSAATAAAVMSMVSIQVWHLLATHGSGIHFSDA